MFAMIQFDDNTAISAAALAIVTDDSSRLTSCKRRFFRQ